MVRFVTATGHCPSLDGNPPLWLFVCFIPPIAVVLCCGNALDQGCRGLMISGENIHTSRYPVGSCA